jgi:hypothetical protein
VHAWTWYAQQIIPNTRCCCPNKSKPTAHLSCYITHKLQLKAYTLQNVVLHFLQAHTHTHMYVSNMGIRHRPTFQCASTVRFDTAAPQGPACRAPSSATAHVHRTWAHISVCKHSKDQHSNATMLSMPCFIFCNSTCAPNTGPHFNSVCKHSKDRHSDAKMLSMLCPSS